MAQLFAQRAVRRVVTGHNPAGQSLIVQDEVSPFTFETDHAPGLVVTDLWKTYYQTDIRESAETCTHKVTLAPPSGGSVFRTVQFPPDHTYMDTWDAHASFEAMGEAGALNERPGKKPGMHRTSTLDYAFVMLGEIWAVMDEGETLLRAGDVLIQRGTNHGWSNRSEALAVVAFVLIDAHEVGDSKSVSTTTTR